MFVTFPSRAAILLTVSFFLSSLTGRAAPVPTETGLVAGTIEEGIQTFRGIPYAAPPTGELRWKPPQPAAHWEGIYQADHFGAHPVQSVQYGDMIFRDAGPSEDCLTLNVWCPTADPGAKLPVMVWIYGGGFQGGGSSEARHDGHNLAKKGVIVVSMNYRLGVFGFLAHPALTGESEHHASGNYGLLDQAAALAWVRRNIAAFGGDPQRLTIFGESAGSFSVSALMASPLSRDLVQGAIGESGAFFRKTLAALSLDEAEKNGLKLAESIGAPSLADLRAKSVDDLLKAVKATGAPHFGPVVDGWYLPKPVHEIYAAGEQAHVPLLAGWNADEHSTAESNSTTVETFIKEAKKQFGEDAEKFLALYPATSLTETHASAAALASDQFIASATWRWLEWQTLTGGGKPVYRYRFDRVIPQPAGESARGAYHAGEIEYVFNNLAYKQLPFTEDDHHLAEQMSSYWTNFAKNGDPNAPGLPEWPACQEKQGYPLLHLGVTTAAAPDELRARYLFLDTHLSAK